MPVVHSVILTERPATPSIILTERPIKNYEMLNPILRRPLTGSPLRGDNQAAAEASVDGAEQTNVLARCRNSGFPI